MVSLEDVINELKTVSLGQCNNVPLPDDEIISQYEKDIGFIFPSDYKKVVKEVGNVFYGTIELLSLSQDKKYYGELSETLMEARELGIPESWIPICEDNGNYYCIDSQGIIRFWSPDGKSDDIWPNIAVWIKEIWIN